MYFLSWRIQINPLPNKLRLLTTLENNPFKNIVGKGENTGYQHFRLFPQCLLSYQAKGSQFEPH